MLRTRWILSAAVAFLVMACTVGCILPASLEPRPPWDDVEAQQASWGRLLEALLVSAFALGAVGVSLLAWGYFRWRVAHRIGS